MVFWLMIPRNDVWTYCATGSLTGWMDTLLANYLSADFKCLKKSVPLAL